MHIRAQTFIIAPALSAPVSAIRFGGEAATRAAREKFLRADMFEHTVRQDRDPYVGTPPKIFRETGLPTERLWAELDRVSEALKKANFLPGMRVRAKLGKAPLIIEQIGAGAHGVNYRMTVAGQDFLFRNFTPSVEDGIEGQGPFGEVSSGLFLSKWQFEDLSAFHMANPVAGWLVDEWIDPSETPEARRRRQPSCEKLETVLTLADLEMVDNKDENYINGIRVDRGGIHSREEAENPSTTLFGSQLWRY